MGQGEPLVYTMKDNTKIVCTYHPAFILRPFGAKHAGTFEADLGFALQLAGIIEEEEQEDSVMEEGYSDYIYTDELTDVDLPWD